MLGWFDGDTLVSQVAVYPMQVRIYGRTYAMGGLTGVGTYPEYSNLGLMHRLLEQALRLYQGRAFWDGTGELEAAFLQEMARKYGLVLL